MKKFEAFLIKADARHDGKYDYSCVDYKNNYQKVKIICLKHGIFEQTPKAHLMGGGCPRCFSKKKTLDKFISGAKKVHGDKYDYSKSIYKGCKKKIKIVCPTHGEFEQIAGSHLEGSGCKGCFIQKKTKTKDDFIKQANDIHNCKYDYCLVDYKNSYTEIKIVCPTHGVFQQRPGGHLAGKGCFLCSIKKQTKINEQFVEQAQRIHKNKYNYSMVGYKGNKIKIKIICKIHGEFEQTPGSHLSGRGCPKCSSTKRKKTTEEFIREAALIHGNKYDYSLVDYKGGSCKIKIICKSHGEFEQLAGGHLSGYGCFNCYGNKAMTTEDFINRAKLIHGNKYEYTFSVYKNSYTKIKIVCLTHGLFEQSPRTHLAGGGCSKCANKVKSTENFISAAKKIHGERYDYSLVEYKNWRTKVKIICCQHGIFEQAAGSHLNKNGCSRCSNNQKPILIELIKKCQLIHNNKYDYSRAVYLNAKSKIKIICEVHGEFEQNLYSHSRGQGCSRCAKNSNSSKISNRWIEKLGIPTIQKEFVIKINGKRYCVDGYDPLTNTIYEFYGNIWHGNPLLFGVEERNPFNNIRYRDLYEKTLEREIELRKRGYKLVTIWESQFKEQL